MLQNRKLAASAALHTPLIASIFSSSTLNRHFSTAMAGAAPPPEPASVIGEKRALRSKVRSALRALSPSQRTHEDCAIQDIVLNSPWFKSSSRLCAYISCDSLREVDTAKIVSEILTSAPGDSQGRKKLYVPRVENKNSHMRMLHISSLDDLMPNSMNILEPSPQDVDGNQREDVMLANDPVDFFLVPGLAFDGSGHRLGRGGGYYDSLLKKYQALCTEKQWKRPLLIALAYSTQILDKGAIPVTDHDIAVDALVSPTGTIPISNTALESLHLED
ncbi:5-formyltetrahydrofolate cycloligase [Wolffia australiana]